MKKTLLFIIALAFTASVVSQPVARQKVLFEIATGTWCVFCPGAAMGAADLLSNGHDVAIIKYHSGDAYTIPASTARISYYGVSGYPTTKIDGILTHVGGSQNQSIYPTYLNFYNQRINVPSPFSIEIYGENTGGLNYEAQIVLTKHDTYTASNLVLHFAVTETDIPQMWFNQTHVKDVLRAMVPDHNGTPLDFSATDEIVVDLSWTMNANWVTDNMSVVAFIQDVPTKAVFQANVVELGDLQPAGITSSFIASASEVCEGEEVTFTCTSSGAITSWLWTFEGGDPETSTEENPVVVYHTPGTFDVTLEVSNDDLSDTHTAEDFMNVHFMPDVPESPDGEVIIDLYYVTTSEYSIEDVTGAEQYTWHLSPIFAGAIEGTGNEAMVTWNTIYTGQAYIKVKAHGDFCETDYSEELEVTITNTVGVEDILTDRQISISPNPGDGLFNLHLPAITHGENVNIVVFDINGKLVWEDQITQAESEVFRINLRNFEQGIYYVSVRSASVNHTTSVSIIR